MTNWSFGILIDETLRNVAFLAHTRSGNETFVFKPFAARVRESLMVPIFMETSVRNRLFARYRVSTFIRSMPSSELSPVFWIARISAFSTSDPKSRELRTGRPFHSMAPTVLNFGKLIVANPVTLARPKMSSIVVRSAADSDVKALLTFWPKRPPFDMWPMPSNEISSAVFELIVMSPLKVWHEARAVA